MKRLISRYGKWIVGTLGAASTSLIVAQCTSSKATETRTNPRNSVIIAPPDYAPTVPWDFNWDMRDPRILKKKVKLKESYTCESDDYKGLSLVWPTARRNIILVRHGQYNQKGNDDDCHTLTKLGEEQAALAGQRLKNSGIKFKSIVSSGMTRAIQTAEIIAKEIGQEGLKVEIRDQILNEGPPCIPEPPYRNPNFFDPHINEFHEHGCRIEAGFRKYIHRAEPTQEEDSHEIIVCHGNVIRYFSMRAMQYPPEGWLRLAIDHTSLTKVTLFPDGDVMMRCIGDSGHLPADKATADVDAFDNLSK